jgi:hypothetical protein
MIQDSSSEDRINEPRIEENLERVIGEIGVEKVEFSSFSLLLLLISPNFSSFSLLFLLTSPHFLLIMANSILCVWRCLGSLTVSLMLGDDLCDGCSTGGG